MACSLVEGLLFFCVNTLKKSLSKYILLFFTSNFIFIFSINGENLDVSVLAL